MKASAKSQDDNDKRGIYSGLLYSTCTWTIRGFRDFLETSSSLGFTFVKKKSSFNFVFFLLVCFVFVGVCYKVRLFTLTHVAVDKYK